MRNITLSPSTSLSVTVAKAGSSRLAREHRLNPAATQRCLSRAPGQAELGHHVPSNFPHVPAKPKMPAAATVLTWPQKMESLPTGT